jgi:hypothetical protein
MIRSDRSITERLPGKGMGLGLEQVGTVHTFQGKEADAVVDWGHGYVLGARRWAGHPPNLLNVAVTRAKRRIYVIGKRDAWKDAELSRILQMLPVLGRPTIRPEMAPRPDRQKIIANNTERETPTQGSTAVHARDHKYEIGRCVSCGRLRYQATMFAINVKADVIGMPSHIFFEGLEKD